MKLFRVGALALGVWAACGPAAALEGYVPYDKFGTTQLDPVRWSDAERSRMLVAGTLRLVQRDWGPTTSDAGTTGNSWSDSLTRGGRVTQLRAAVRVGVIDMTGCINNATPTLVRARVMGTFFNSGNRSPGSNVGDVFAQMYLSRASNSVDAPGVLRVEGRVLMCTSSDCNNATPIGSTVALGTAQAGVYTFLQIEWDKANKQFLFSRDKGVATPLPYNDIDDSADPGNPFKSVGTRTDVANCASGPRAFGYVDARFDNVQVNASAKP